MIPTTLQIADRLDDLVTHAGVWSRLLHERARRSEGAEESAPGLRAAAATISEWSEVFRTRAAAPGAAPFELLRAADRALSAAPVLRDALLAETGERSGPDDLSWLTHETAVLDRLLATRADLIRLPPPGDGPTEELRALQDFTRLLGSEIMIEFETGPDGATRLSAVIGAGPSPELPEELEREAAKRAIRLADPLIRCEIPDWDAPPGANGRLRILPDEAPWLDAVDHAKDWLLERHVDLDELAETSLDAPEMEAAEDGAPEP